MDNSETHEKALESFRKIHKEAHSACGKNWCCMQAFHRAGILDKNNMSACLAHPRFQDSHLLINHVQSDCKAPIGVLGKEHGSYARDLIITACLELRVDEAAVVGSYGRNAHHWFTVVGTEGGFRVHHAFDSNVSTHPYTGAVFRYALSPEFFDGMKPTRGNDVVVCGLQSEAGKKLNSRRGKVIDEISNGRICVKIGDFVKSIRPHNLIVLEKENNIIVTAPEKEIFGQLQAQTQEIFGEEYSFTPIQEFVYEYCRNKILTKEQLVAHFEEIVISQVDFDDGSMSVGGAFVVCAKRDARYFIQIQTPERYTEPHALSRYISSGQGEQ